MKCLFEVELAMTWCLLLVESGVTPRVQDRGQCQRADHLARVITLIDNKVKHEREMVSSDLVMGMRRALTSTSPAGEVYNCTGV